MAECSFCGEDHGPGPVGELRTAFGGIEFKVCPALPTDHIYEDVEFETGPPGRLYSLFGADRVEGGHQCADGWVCEQHPTKPWPHDDCPGPGMPCEHGCDPFGGENTT